MADPPASSLPQALSLQLCGASPWQTAFMASLLPFQANHHVRRRVQEEHLIVSAVSHTLRRQYAHTTTELQIRSQYLDLADRLAGVAFTAPA
jgi:hypothetical protein